MSVTTEEPAIRPFMFGIPEPEIEALCARIAATRWPEKETVADHSQGVQRRSRNSLATGRQITIGGSARRD
jgi:hypothetical protein